MAAEINVFGNAFLRTAGTKCAVAGFFDSEPLFDNDGEVAKEIRRSSAVETSAAAWSSADNRRLFFADVNDDARHHAAVRVRAFNPMS